MFPETGGEVSSCSSCTGWEFHVQELTVLRLLCRLSLQRFLCYPICSNGAYDLIAQTETIALYHQ